MDSNKRDQAFDIAMKSQDLEKSLFDPDEVFHSGLGVCSGISALIFWMMDSAGVPCATVYNLNHAFNAIFIEDYDGSSKWALMDATWGCRFRDGGGGVLAKIIYKVDNFYIKLLELLRMINFFPYEKVDESNVAFNKLDHHEIKIVYGDDGYLTSLSIDEYNRLVWLDKYLQG